MQTTIKGSYVYGIVNIANVYAISLYLINKIKKKQGKMIDCSLSIKQLSVGLSVHPVKLFLE